MIKHCCLIVCLLLLSTTGTLAEEKYESLALINSTNWAGLFDNFFASLPPSQGELQFSPVNAALLCRLLPPGTNLKIAGYDTTEESLPFRLENVPQLAQITGSLAELEKHKKRIANSTPEVTVYPSLGELVIMINGQPYTRVALRAGYHEGYLPVEKVIPGGEIVWQKTAAVPTPTGDFRITGSTKQFLSGNYYQETVIPFGTWLLKNDRGWVYKVADQWFTAPDFIAADLERPAAERRYLYYDLSQDGRAACWAGNIFGPNILMWTKHGELGFPSLGYARGEICYEQRQLIKVLVQLLVVDGDDDFDTIAKKSDCLLMFSQQQPTSWESGDQRLTKALGEFKENRLPRDPQKRREALGLYFYIQKKDREVERQKEWHNWIRNNWSFLGLLREKLRDDFNKMGIMSKENRQNVLEKWIINRINLLQVKPPKEAKYVSALSFTGFFRPTEKPSVFSQRERELMVEVIKKGVSGEAGNLKLQSVGALNQYNFGRILNDILGNLYRSHGCLHVSPRNSYFLYEILPVNARLRLNSYQTRLSEEAYQEVSMLADLVNFEEDLTKLKETLQTTSEVKIIVYPQSGLWLINLKDQPFARVRVRVGPQTKRYQLLSRDEKGRPIFETHLAYPTTPGNYRIFRKVTDYVSNIYYNITIVPMGGEIKRQDNPWSFQDKSGRWRSLPKDIADDLAKPAEARTYSYYNETVNSIGEVVRLRWGSHPFGKYAIQTTKDGHTPFPELIHSSGDLIMEERQLINDLIQIMAAPFDELDDCLVNSPNFEVYRNCSQFINGSGEGEMLDDLSRAGYKLYYDLPLTTAESQALPLDAVAAHKVERKEKLSPAEVTALRNAGIVKSSQGKTIYNQERLAGLNYDTYLYVVMIEKYAHHYQTLKNYWQELSDLRWAMLKDLNDFVLKDPQIFYSFMRELMLERINLEKLTQSDALRQLGNLIQ